MLQWGCLLTIIQPCTTVEQLFDSFDLTEWCVSCRPQVHQMPEAPTLPMPRSLLLGKLLRLQLATVNCTELSFCFDPFEAVVRNETARSCNISPLLHNRNLWYRQPPVQLPVLPEEPSPVSSSGQFTKQKVWEAFKPHYRLATRHEVQSNETAVHEAMPGWEIAYLADGTTGGALYGNSTS